MLPGSFNVARTAVNTMARAYIVSLLMAAALALATGCSVKRMAVNQVGNALAGGGATFASDDDPELIKQAVPFGLKLQESLLAESPNHRGLLLASCKGFTQYAYAFVQQEADRLEGQDVAAAKAQRERARHLYLRARDYGLRGLETRYRGFRAEPLKSLAGTRRADVPLLYWTGAAWGAAIAVSKDKPEIVADLPKMAALMERALALEESFDRGALHTFFINFEMGRPGTKPAEAVAKAQKHFARARELADGKLASPFVTFAEAVCVQQQDKAGFEKNLQAALAVDVDALPECRLENTIMQRRARWLLGRTEELFAE